MDTTALRLSILGPVRARRGATDLELGGRQQRLLLALLLARAGSVVGLAELVDAIWADDPPVSAVNTIHRAIGVLRRLIEPDLPVRAPGEHIVRHSAGYRLEVGEDALDLLQFRAYARRARQAADDADKTRLHAAALALWQGPCAAGLEPVSRTHPVFVALEAELAQVARDAADVALRSGTAGMILPDLLRIGGWTRLDEAMQARIMLTLAAQGRQAEALETYHQVRRRLAEELGIDPGAELRRSHDRVLRGQDGPAVTPAQLPPDHPYYSGRAQVLARAEELLADDRRHGRGTVALAFDGLPGVGKTTVAVHLAHRLAPAYPDGQLSVDLRGYAAIPAPLTPGEALRGFLHSLGVRTPDLPAEDHAAAGMFRSLVAGRRMLILLDNCRDYQQIRDLLPGTPTSLAIVTSRVRLGGLIAAGAHPLPLDLPSEEEAEAYLVRRLGQARTAAEPAAIRRIIDACDRHPLALAIVAAHAVATPGASLASIAGETAGFEDLTAVFSWSYRELTPAAERLFRLIPLYPGAEITPEVAAALAGIDVRTARHLLGELGAQMLTQVRGGRHHMHDLIRAYAADLSEDEDPPQVRRAAVARLAGHLGGTPDRSLRD
nr:BTAD domain-containing putative transcriptional regulator [uncultured Actinoplanes sp.]